MQTKAKMNYPLSRGSVSDFGMESMFEKSRYSSSEVGREYVDGDFMFSRQRQNIADEDAPPINSIYDIPNDAYADPKQARYQPRVRTSYHS